MMWIKHQGIPRYGESDESRLAYGLSSQITSWQGYDINGYRFHTKEKDKKSAAQNSRVQYEGIDEATGETKTYLARLKRYGNLTMAVNYRYPSSGASGSS